MGVLRSAGAMGVGTFFSRILGLVREQVFAFLFGAGNATDAFNIAFRIPNLLRDLFAEGAMSAALVPTFTRVRTEEGARRGWRVAGLVFRALFVVVSILAVFGIIFAPQLVELYASAFHAVPGKFELTVSMTRTMFPFFPLVALAAAYMGILNACGKFFLPAFSSALFNLTSVAVGVVLAYVLPRFGHQAIEGMAIGVVLGGTVQAFCQLPALRRLGYRWQKRETGEAPWSRDPALRRVLVLMIPGTVGLAATQINILVNSVLATSQGPGAVSWLNYAFRLMQFPIGVLGVSFAAATLPQVSRLWVGKDLDGVRETITKSVKQVVAINLAAAAGLAFLGVPIIRMIFEYGHFSPQDTEATAQALAAYAVGLAAYSAVKVLVPACYALGNTRVAVISSVFSVAATITFNLILIGPLGYVGLALGTSLAAVLNCLQLIWAIRKLMRKAGSDLPLRPLVDTLLRGCAVALVMGLSVYATSRFLLQPFLPDILLLSWLGRASVPLMRLLKVGVLVLEGGGLVLLLAQVFKLTEISDAGQLFSRKIKKKLSRDPT